MPASRQSRAAAEPKVKLEPEDVRSAPSWPADTDLVFPAGRGKPSLIRQSARVRRVITLAFDELAEVFTFDDAFPDGDEETTLFRDLLLNGADKVDRDIKSRLKYDHAYAGHMVSMVCDYFSDLANAHVRLN